MGIRAIMDEAHITYGPYRDGDKPEFTADPALATASFDIFEYKVCDSKLKHSHCDEVACFCAPDGDEPDWCVIDSDGSVGDHIENLYFTFPGKPDAPVKSDMEDTVNHPKHYTGRKADLECIMFTELMPSLAANAFKYVWRCDDKKNKTEDLEKARWYLNRVCATDFLEHAPGRKARSLMSGLIEGSDFDYWHKRVLIKIINGYYVDAYNAISDLIGKTRYVPVMSKF